MNRKGRNYAYTYDRKRIAVYRKPKHKIYPKKFSLDEKTVADAIDMEPLDYTEIETGNNSVSLLTMYKLAAFFGVAIDEFCQLKNAPKPEIADDTGDPNILEEQLKMSSCEKTGILLARYWNIPVYEVVSEIVELRKENDKIEDEYFPGYHKIDEEPLLECHKIVDET